MSIKSDLDRMRNPVRAKTLSGFFKTGPGQYGEGDIFLGLTAPQIREMADKYKDIGMNELRELLNSKVHEHRSVAVVILTHQFKKDPETVFDFYLKNRRNINNWDLVDISAPNIVGTYLLTRDRKILYKLAKGKLWERRIAIISTLAFIRNNQFDETLNISKMLLSDEHDLIHKAVGWMLREVGKKNMAVEENFLKRYSGQMPRTMLRYAIEKFPESKRKIYMKK